MKHTMIDYIMHCACICSVCLLIHRILFSKNMVDQRVGRIDWIFTGIWTSYWNWEIVAD